jgi:hypothetical protein
VTESKEYKELIKKEIDNYLNLIKKAENDEKFKQIVWQLKYFLSIINEESYVPLYLSDLSKITFNDNFSPFYSINVPAGVSTELYLETNINETMLLNIEFYLEDKTKDITFEVKKYDINNNTFKNIIKEEKIFDAFKFFVLCNGYCLYQIVFNNSYSWFHSKDINYRISLLRTIDKNKTNLNENLNKFKEKEKKEEKQNIKEENKIKKEINKEKDIEILNKLDKEKSNKREEINLDGAKDKKTEEKNKDEKKEGKNEKVNKQIQEKEMTSQEKKEDKLEKDKEKIKGEKKEEIKEKNKEEKKEEKKGQKIEIIEKIIVKNANQKKNLKNHKIDEIKEKQKEDIKEKNIRIIEDIKIETKIDKKDSLLSSSFYNTGELTIKDSKFVNSTVSTNRQTYFGLIYNNGILNIENTLFDNNRLLESTPYDETYATNLISNEKELFLRQVNVTNNYMKTYKTIYGMIRSIESTPSNIIINNSFYYSSKMK